jgi:two-component system phosphate regulon sensor histidine kinase PhoR
LYLYSAALVEGTGPIKYARTALPSNRIDQLETRYAWLIVGVVLVSMLLFTLIAYAAVRRFSYPVERLADAVERSASGEFELDVPPARGVELARLVSAVKRMQQEMLEKIDELTSERTVLASVITGMREGLLLIGPDRRVRLANPPLVGIFGLSFEPEGRLIEEVVRHPAVLQDVEAALAAGGEVRNSIFRPPGSNRTFELHVTPLAAAGNGTSLGALVLFFEITRLEKLEGVRREFVANVSHELRTPLTSIKAFVENMIDDGLDDRENADRFLKIISKHADRMGELIEDLTDLSLIETGSIALEMREVDAGKVASEVAEHLRPAATSRKVEIISDVPAPFVLVADRRRLEQMLTNLLDNAIKFNREGGKIWVRGRVGDSGPLLEVEDTGIGIAADSQEKIFNRFFRAHRERPRDVGGTGLGLAIVKHLMRLHGGTVTVDAELGRGATFTLRFKSAASQPAPPPPARA